MVVLSTPSSESSDLSEFPYMFAIVEQSNLDKEMYLRFGAVGVFSWSSYSSFTSFPSVWYSLGILNMRNISCRNMVDALLDVSVPRSAVKRRTFSKI